MILQFIKRYFDKHIPGFTKHIARKALSRGLTFMVIVTLIDNTSFKGLVYRFTYEVKDMSELLIVHIFYGKTGACDAKRILHIGTQ